MKYCRHSALAMLLISATAVGQQLRVQVEQLDADRYELTLFAGAPMTEPAAQGLLWPSASRLCNGNEPNFGKYRFESVVPLAGGDTTQDLKSSFKFVQEISCGGATSPRTSHGEPALPPTDLLTT